MKTGIAGSNGFIGSYLSQRMLAGRSGMVRLLARREPVGTDLRRAEIVRGDLSSTEDCVRFAADLDVIYYSAHTNSPVNSDRDQAADAVANQIPLLNLIGAVQHLGTRPHIVYFSSGGAIYGTRHDRIPFRESDACEPLSSYGIQKLAAEHYLRLAAHKGHLTATVLRIGNVYGTPLPTHRTQGLIGVAINCVVSGRPVRVFGDSANVRDYVHLEDLCKMVDRASIPKREFDVVNVGSGCGHSVMDVLRLIEDCCGHSIEIQADTSRGHWLSDWVVLDRTKAAKEFGWTPRIDLPSGILGMMSYAEVEPKCMASIA